MLIAKAWYESGSFWQFIITTLVAVAVGALASYATMRAAHPKRRLGYLTRTNAPLFIASHDQTGSLQVTHNGTSVSRPRVIELELYNSGRRDITAAQFHDDAPLKFDLGADVVGVLGVTSSPAGGVAPAVAVDSVSPKVVAISPSLFSRRQAVRATFLVDGPGEDVSCVQQPLIDVDVRPQAGAETPTLASQITGVAVVLAIFGGLLGLLKLVEP